MSRVLKRISIGIDAINRRCEHFWNVDYSSRYKMMITFSSRNLAQTLSWNIVIEESNQEKQYYAIGEVARMFNLSISNIRFWEQEFEILRPKKNRKGDRFFTKQDIENLKIIYHLLKEKGYTIEGARKKLMKNPREISDRMAMIESLKKIRSLLVMLKENLERKDKAVENVTGDAASEATQN